MELLTTTPERAMSPIIDGKDIELPVSHKPIVDPVYANKITDSTKRGIHKELK
jgi:hypothetical protein